MTNDRPYQKAHTHARAVEFIRSQNGRHFDPAVVEAFLTLEPPA